MSRIGRTPVKVPNKVTVSVDKNIIVKGPKGELSMPLSNQVGIDINTNDNIITFTPLNNTPQAKKLHGTYRASVANMIKGVTDGFEKKLELQGVGYRGQVQGKSLVLNVGYSHQITIPAPEGINLAVEANTKVTVNGIDKQLVGQVAANIRATRPPEPYKGKGVRYEGEYVRKKAGKTGK
jgi:large subunit ribosomal protein L6